jgi:hypothetical protein
MTSSIQPATLRVAALVLLAASTLLFASGVAAERASGPAPAAASASTESPGHVEGSGTEGPVHQDSDAGAPAEHGVGGVDLEGLPAVTAAVLASGAIAAALWFWWRRGIVIAVALLFAVAFAVLDVREVVHQAGAASPPLALLAAGVATLHAGTAIALILLVRSVSLGTRSTGRR